MLKKSLLIALSAGLLSVTFAADATTSWNVQVTWDNTAPTITVTSDQTDVTTNVSWANMSWTTNLDSVELVSPCEGEACNVTWAVTTGWVDAWSMESTGAQAVAPITTMDWAASSMSVAWTWAMDQVGNIKVGPQMNYIILSLILLVSVVVLYKVNSSKQTK